MNKQAGRWKLFLVGALAALMAAVTAGCSGSLDPEELFSLPQPPEDYRNLNLKIEEVLKETGGESIAPTSGSNTQTVQLQDLDGDGFQESAVAFFRVPNEEKPLKIYIFRLQPDDSYAQSTVIEEVGASISSVEYENVGGDGAKEVIVSWQISTTDHTLGVYSLDDVEGIELMWVDHYTRFRSADLDGDGERELAVVNLETGEETAGWVDYYDFDGAALALKSSAALSRQVGSIVSVRGGSLAGGVPALYVTSAFEDDVNKGQVVDILAVRDGALTNVTLDSDTGFSGETVRYYTAVSGLDINGDGAMELPRPQVLPTKSGDSVYLLEWRQFDLSGKPKSVFTTFHNVTDGWYFIVPGEWTDQLTIARRDSVTTDERAVTFFRWRGVDEEPEPFLTLYKFTGTNRVNRASSGRRQVLISDASAVYAYEWTQGVWETELDASELLRRFNIISPEWSTDY